MRRLDRPTSCFSIKPLIMISSSIYPPKKSIKVQFFNLFFCFIFQFKKNVSIKYKMIHKIHKIKSSYITFEWLRSIFIQQNIFPLSVPTHYLPCECVLHCHHSKHNLLMSWDTKGCGSPGRVTLSAKNYMEEKKEANKW